MANRRKDPWPTDARTQGISNQVIDLVFPGDPCPITAQLSIDVVVVSCIKQLFIQQKIQISTKFLFIRLIFINIEWPLHVNYHIFQNKSSHLYHHTTRKMHMHQCYYHHIVNNRYSITKKLIMHPIPIRHLSRSVLHKYVSRKVFSLVLMILSYVVLLETMETMIHR